MACWLLLLLISTVFAHTCIHDDLEDRIAPHRVTNVVQDYKLPASGDLTGASYSPIRITVDGRFLTLSDQSKKDFIIKQIIPAAVKYIQSALAVIPVSGNLILQKQCARYYENPYRCIQYYEPTGCLDIDSIPSEHLAPNGKGIPNTDLVLYVTAVETSGNTIAYAAACQFDQKNRPIAGNINFGPGHITVTPVGSQLWWYQLSTAIHEIWHVLGFSKSSFPKFIQQDGTPYPVVTKTVSERGDPAVVKMMTPRATKAARDHFGCSSLDGVEIENRGGSGSAGSHWKKRIFNDEFMVAVQSELDFPSYSTVTLALMEDSGWYQANYSAATQFDWGKGRGCNFAQQKCLSNGRTNYPDMFCNDTSKRFCSNDRRSRAQCGLSQYQSALPAQYQYFSDRTLGGDSESMDYCPYWEPFHFVGGITTVCGEASNQPASNYWGERYGSGSRCFESTLLDQSFSRYIPPDGSACFTYTCNPFRVKVGNNIVDCSSSPGARKTVSGFSGYLVCPSDPKIYCP